VCDYADNANDCTALQAFAKSLNSDGWVKNTYWGSDKSVCGWHGVTCASGRVTEISLEHNKLAGSLPDEIGLLEELQSLDLNGGRPADYGCGGGKLYNLILIQKSLR
jgi:hypothetical protein